MSDKLKQAIQASRAGDKKNAQFLLTQAIQENPDNPQSWYLLSLLVDDDAKKQSYLTKVVDLDPGHAKAHEKLIAMTETAVIEETMPEPAEATPVILSSDSPDLESQDGGETLPDWMADDLPDTDEKPTTVADEAAVATEADHVPDWLDGALDEDWDKAETETAVTETVTKAKEDTQPEQKIVEEKKELTKKETKPAKSKAKDEKQLNYLLIGLVIISIIVFLIMAFMIFDMMS